MYLRETKTRTRRAADFEGETALRPLEGRMRRGPSIWQKSRSFPVPAPAASKKQTTYGRVGPTKLKDLACAPEVLRTSARWTERMRGLSLVLGRPRYSFFTGPTQSEKRRTYENSQTHLVSITRVVGRFGFPDNANSPRTRDKTRNES